MRKQQEAINISIPKPCHEDWDKMTANEQGRHCTSCNKTVVDFSLYSDKELFEFFKKANGAICGRINHYQANRPILVTEQPNRTFLHKLFLGTALASWLGLTGTANAQSKTTHAITQQNNPRKIIGHMSTVPSNDTSSKLCTVKGKVYDLSAGSKQTIPFAEIQILTMDKTVIYTAFTDIDGKFKFNVPERYIGNKLMLFYSYPGYDDETVNFVATGSIIDIELDVNEHMQKTLGVMIIHKEPPLDTPGKTVTKPGDTPYNTPRK